MSYLLPGLAVSKLSPLSLLQATFPSTPYWLDFIGILVTTALSVWFLYRCANLSWEGRLAQRLPPLWLICAALFFPGLSALLLSGNPFDQAATSGAALLAISTGILICVIAKTIRNIRIGLSLLVIIQAVYSFLYYIAKKNVLVSGEILRAGGTFFDTNQLYTMMLVAIPLVFAAYFQERNQWIQILYLLASAGALATLLITFYRGGMLALFLCLCVMAWRITRSLKTTLIVIVALLFLCGSIINYRSQGSVSSASVERSNIGHLRLWQEGMRIFSQHPITGVGPGNFQITVIVPSENGNVLISRSLREPKNILLFYLGELGTSGGILICLLALVVIKIFQSIGRNGAAESETSIGVECAWIALITAGIFDTIFGPGDRYVGNCYLGLLLGMTALLVHKTDNKQDTVVITDDAN